MTEQDASEDWTDAVADGAAPPRVLVVDDEPMIRALVRATLQADRRFQLLLATDGEEALAAARRWRPAVAILDVMMPKLDGFEVCRALRADPATRNAQIVLLTALGQPSDLARGHEAGADGYFVKPFDPEALLTQVEASLARALQRAA